MSACSASADSRGQLKSRPDIRLVELAAAIRPEHAGDGVEKPFAVAGQIANERGAHARWRADKADIGPRLSAALGMRLAESPDRELNA